MFSLFRRQSSLVILADVYSERQCAALIVEIRSLLDRYHPGEVRELPDKDHLALCQLVARRAFVSYLAPQLRELRMPATVIVNPARIGINRLSVDEELATYRLAFPKVGCEMTLDELKKSLGPLPVERISPMLFPPNWKEINGLGASISLAWCVDLDDAYPPNAQLTDIERLAGRRPAFVIGDPMYNCEIPKLQIERTIVFENGRELPYRRVVETLRLDEGSKIH